MRTLVLSFAIVVALGGGVALAQYGTPDPPTPPPAATKAPAPAPSASPVSVVHIKDFKYVPETVTIRAGDSVRFIEDDETPHTVTAQDKSFDSGNLERGKTYAHKFERPGTYVYICTYHPYMKGTVVVKAP